ncbi:ACT domain-containing protein [Erythrobacter sp. NE805]|uniref:ACT domain-containing protein n=1 Tax=Erythrobacter sp. NE805 TaxID=3389875 RepID=UPI00396AFF64
MTAGSGPVGELAAMLAGMAPVLDARRWDFAVVEGEPPAEAFAIIREDEGVTAILPDAGGGFARVTLKVHSALDGVGLTAAVATALAGRGIACNVVAGFHHDHLFVPWDRREEAVEALTRLAQGVAAGAGPSAAPSGSTTLGPLP